MASLYYYFLLFLSPHSLHKMISFILNNGPQSDTIKVFNLHGMTYLKMKTGSMVQLWLFDIGSSDLLMNKDVETILKEEGIIKPENYLGP